MFECSTIRPSTNGSYIAKCTDGPQATCVCSHVLSSFMIKLINNWMLVAPGEAAQEGVAASIYRAEVTFEVLPEVR